MSILATRLLRVFRLAPLSDLERHRAAAGKARRQLLEARVEIEQLRAPLKIIWRTVEPWRPWWRCEYRNGRYVR